MQSFRENTSSSSCAVSDSFRGLLLLLLLVQFQTVSEGSGCDREHLEFQRVVGVCLLEFQRAVGVCLVSEGSAEGVSFRGQCRGSNREHLEFQRAVGVCLLLLLLQFQRAV